MASAETTSATEAAAASSAHPSSAAPATTTPAPPPSNGVDGFPDWLQPGVSPGIHMGLRMVLFVLNGLLGWCALLQVLSPHFEFMFLLSLGLTGSYYWFMWEVGKIQAPSSEATQEPSGAGATSSVRAAEAGGKTEGKKDL